MNIKEAFIFAKNELIKAGVDDPAFDTIYLFEHIFSYSRTDITVFGDREVENEKLSYLKECIKRRRNGEPVQYIIGKWYFMGNTPVSLARSFSSTIFSANHCSLPCANPDFCKDELSLI